MKKKTGCTVHFINDKLDSGKTGILLGNSSKRYNNIEYRSTFLIAFIILLILLISVYFRAVRWKILFNPQYNIDTKSLFDIQLIGYFGNNILPLRLGELLRTLVVGEKYKIKKTAVLGSIILERILDMFAVGMFLIVLFFLNYELIIGINNILLISSSLKRDNSTYCKYPGTYRKRDWWTI